MRKHIRYPINTNITWFYEKFIYFMEESSTGSEIARIYSIVHTYLYWYVCHLIPFD